jgi:hypothetical protein
MSKYTPSSSGSRAGTLDDEQAGGRTNNLIPFQSKRALFLGHLMLAVTIRRKCLGLHVNCPIFLPDFNHLRWIFEQVFYESPVSNLTEILSVGSALIRADRRTNRHYEGNMRCLHLYERSEVIISK